ncbi:hypothetical protein [Nocardia asiatica]|uniref:hypothetical protein n=1 Tax=Nocardia asiatica TaxID=209252 RepID=UPI0024554171|nr:hypothetical protein [Nocardia asiatica]
MQFRSERDGYGVDAIAESDRAACVGAVEGGGAGRSIAGPMPVRRIPLRRRDIAKADDRAGPRERRYPGP